MLALVVYNAESLPMGFTLPRTRLIHNHLGLLSCQRLWPLITLTTWISVYSRWVWPIL